MDRFEIGYWKPNLRGNERLGAGKNPPAHQLEREQDWDGPVILSPLAFVLVDLVTPFLRAERLAPLGVQYR